MLKLVVFSALLICSFFVQAQEGGETDVSTQASQFDPSMYLFPDAPDLETSLAVTKENGRIYLIVEVNHNPFKNSFVISYHDAGVLPQRALQVLKANKAFGFSNKFQVQMPLIEMKSPEGSRVFDDVVTINSELNRTQQLIDVTRVLNMASRDNGITGAAGTVYALEDLSDVVFALSGASFEMGLSSIEEGKINHLYGKRQITRASLSLSKRRSRLSAVVVSRYFAKLVEAFQYENFEVNRREQIKETLLSMPYDMTVDEFERAVELLLNAESPADMVLIGIGLPAKRASVGALSCKALL